MKKLFKILAIAVVVVVVLIGGAAVVLPMLVDPQDIKAELSTKVKEQTGRDLNIPGEVGLSVFPWLGVKLGVVELGNAKGFSDAHFARIEKVNVRVKIMPLLSSRLEMDTVTLHGLSLNLERDKNGHTNWDDLAGKGKAEGSADSGHSDSGEAMGALAIGGLDIRNANLSFKDVQAGQAFAIKNLSMKTGPVRSGEPLDIDLGFDLNSANPPITGQVTGSAQVDVNPDAQQVKLSELKIDADLKGKTLPGGEAKVSLQAQAMFDGKKQQLNVSELLLSALDLKVSGALTASELDKGGQLAGQLEVAEFNPRTLLKALGQPELEMADAKALTRLSLKTSLSGNNKSVSLKPLTVKLDESTLNGELRVVDIQRAALRFALALDQIDVDRYLPPPKEGEGAKAATPGAAAGKAGELPLETLRGLDVDGTFKVGKLKVAKLNISDASVHLKANKGLIQMNPITANLYEGGYTGNIALDARKDKPKLSLDEKLAKVQIGPLLKDLQGEDKLTGTANLSAKLTAVGTTEDAVKRTLNGNMAFQFLDGSINGVNLAEMIRSAKASILGGKSAATSGPQKTDFAEITGTAKVKNGLVMNPDLSAKSPLLRLSGKGQASLPAETIDYKATATVVASSQGQGGKDLQDLAGVPIPVHITGTFTDPKYGLDMAALGQALVGSKVKDLVKSPTAVIDGAKNLGGGVLDGAKKAGGGIGGALKGLLNN